MFLTHALGLRPQPAPSLVVYQSGFGKLLLWLLWRDLCLGGHFRVPRKLLISLCLLIWIHKGMFSLACSKLLSIFAICLSAVLMALSIYACRCRVGKMQQEIQCAHDNLHTVPTPPFYFMVLLLFVHQLDLKTFLRHVYLTVILNTFKGTC